MTDLTATAKRRLEELVSFFGINADVSVELTDEGIMLDITASPDPPRLIGFHGETLRAIEFLMNQIIKRADGDSPRVSVDVAGYKLQRREQLEKEAREAAERVVAAGAEEELRPMNPAERRIVHMALAEQGQVDTHSVGEGDDRRVVITPR